MRIFTSLFFSLVCLGLAAQQSIRPADLVADYHASRQVSVTTAPLQIDLASHDKVTELKADQTDYNVYQLNSQNLANIIKEAPAGLQIFIPQANKESLVLDLVRVNPFTQDFSVIDSKTRLPAQVDLGVHYRGVVQNDYNSLVALSFFDEEIMGFISHKNKNLVLGRLKGDDFQKNEHILYDDRVVFATEAFECGTADDGYVYTEEELSSGSRNSRTPGDCVRLYYEIDFDITQNKGGLTGATNYAVGIHNEVATMFANENIPTVASEILVWTTTSPYSSNSSSGMLNAFQANHGFFNGDLASLFSYQASGGVAAGFNGICNSNPDASMCFSSIGSSFQTVPTYSWTIDVATHELGHIFGSRHTHACVWNGNGTAIDGCSGSTEGSCSLPGNPSNGGTVMSYCHIASVGKNLALGFGSQPGDVIRNRIDNATCLSNCGPPTCDDGFQNGDETGIDCGGSDCPDCPTCDDGIQNGDEEGVDCGGPDCNLCPCEGVAMQLTINLDNYPGETTWSITNSNQVTVAQGGAYGNFPDGSTVIEAICLQKGCYTFTINDSYGDGICCGFGNGSYELIDQDGITHASGGNFDFSEATPFCISDDGGDDEGCAVTLDNENFESSLGIWNDGGSDCQRYSGSDNANSGQYSVRIRDNTTSSNTTSDPINAASWEAISVAFSYLPESMENGEDFFLEYSTNGGGSYSVAANWVSGQDFENGTRYNEIVTIAGPLSGNTVLRFRCDASTNSDAIYLDDIRIGGCDDNVVTPTCNDGEQNGDETGVDCGGPDCQPCDEEATCDDGEQNGDETGVDCGGTNCPACPTCDDGEQNGNETGVDCGGFDCPDCPTCDDGVQNGDEEGVDCGGANCAPCENLGCTDADVNENDFETSLGTWIDAGSDCARIANNSYANSGSYTVRLRDNTSSSMITTQPISAANYSAMTINFYYRASSMETGEDFFLEYTPDGSDNYIEAGRWVSGQDFQNNEAHNESITFEGQFTNNLRVRFRCDASTNSDLVYLDDISIKACTGLALGNPNTSTATQQDQISNVRLYPIPATDFLKVDFQLDQQTTVQYTIADLTGRTIQAQKLGILEGRQSIRPDVSQLSAGVYLLHLQTANGQVVKRFVITR